MAGEIKLAIVLTAVMKGSEAFDKAGRGIRGMGAAIKSIMPMLQLLAAQAAFAFLKDSIQTFIEFEQTMAEAGSIIGKTKDEMVGMSDAIREMTERVPQSANELGAGLYDILSAGITDSKESLDALELSAQAASAGLTQTATAAKAGISTMNAFGMESDDLSHIFDVQFLTIRYGILRYEELAGVIGKLAPAANQAGQSMESMFSTLAGLTKKGMNAAEASTSLARAYTAIAKPITIRKAMEMGVSIVQLTDAARNAHTEFRKQDEMVKTLTADYDQATASIKGLGDEMAGISLDQQKNRLKAMKIRQKAADEDRDLTDDELANIEELEDANSKLDIQYQEMSISQTELQMKADDMTESIKSQQEATDAAKKAFDDEVAITGKFRPLVDIVKDLNDNMVGLGEVAKAEIIAELFPEIRARKAIMGIIGSEEDMMAITDEMMEQSGAMAEAYAINTDTAAADMKKLENAFDELKIEMGQALIPILKEFIPILKEDIIPIIRDLFIPAIQGIFEVIKVVLDVIRPLLVFLREHPEVIKMLVTALIAWKIAQIALNFAMTANPIGIIIMLIALLVIGIIMLLDELGLLDDIIDALGGAFEAFGDAVGGIFEGLMAIIQPLVDAMEWVLDNIGKVTGFAGDVGGGLVSGVGGLLGFQTGGIIPGATGVPIAVKGHGGEGIFTPDQMRALGGGGGGTTIETHDTFNIKLEITEEITKDKVKQIFDWFGEEARRRKMVGG